MEKFNLQGKSMCSFLMSLGCNMAGVAGSRVIDNAGQRFLTMLLVWSIPCGTTLAGTADARRRVLCPMWAVRWCWC